MKDSAFNRLVWGAVFASLLACAPRGAGEGAGPLVAEDIGPTVEASIGTDGGVVSTTHDGVTYALTFPPGALREPATISMTPARFVGVEGSVAVRLEPDGLALQFPVPLVISPRPAGEVPLAVVAGDAPIEAALAVPSADKVVLPVAHFSTHGVSKATEMLRKMGADFRALVDEVYTEDSVEDPQVAALALGELYRTKLAPLVDAASQGPDALLQAAGPLSAWYAIAQDAPEALDLPHQIRGTQTLGELYEAGKALLVKLARTQLAAYTRPACTAQVQNVGEWVDAPNNIAAVLEWFMDVDHPAVELCVDARVVLTGPASLTPTDDEVRLSARHELVAPGGKTLPVPAVLSLALSGLSGPEQLDLLDGGVAADVPFTRPATNRPAGVRVEATADSKVYRLGVVPAPAAVYEAFEAGTGATITVTPASLGPNDATAEVCVTAMVASTPASDFTVEFTVTGGATPDSAVVAAGGTTQCTTLRRPSPTPVAGATVSVHADVRSLPNGTTLRADKSIAVAAGQLSATLSAPNLVAKNTNVSVCLDLLENGVPANLPWTATFRAFHDDGDNPITEEGVFGLGSPVVAVAGAQGCIVWTSPNRFVDVTMTGTATTADGRTFVATKTVSVNVPPPPPLPNRGLLNRAASMSVVGVTRSRDDSHVTPAPITQVVLWDLSPSSTFLRGDATLGTFTPLDTTASDGKPFSIFGLSGTLGSDARVTEQVVVGADSSVTTGSVVMQGSCSSSFTGTGLPNCNQVLANDTEACAQGSSQGRAQYRLQFDLKVPTAIVLAGSHQATGNASVAVGSQSSTRVRLYGPTGTSLDLTANSRTNGGTFTVTDRVTLTAGEWNLEVTTDATCFNADSAQTQASYVDDAHATLTWTLEDP